VWQPFHGVASLGLQTYAFMETTSFSTHGAHEAFENPLQSEKTSQRHHHVESCTTHAPAPLVSRPQQFVGELHCDVEVHCLAHRRLPAESLIQISPTAQHVLPHGIEQHCPAMQVWPAEQHALPQALAVGQHLPPAQVSPAAQHTLPQTLVATQHALLMHV